MATASTYAFPTAMRRPLRLNRRRILSVGLMLAALCRWAGVCQWGWPTAHVPGAGRSSRSCARQRYQWRRFRPGASRAARVDGRAGRTWQPPHRASSASGWRSRSTPGCRCCRRRLQAGHEVVPGFQRIAFPVGSEHAAGGRMNVGDSVRVYVTTDRGKSDAHTTVALDQAVISAVGYQDVGLASTAGSSDAAAQRAPGKLAWVELLVDDGHAADFVQVLASGDPDVAVLPPSQSGSAGGAGQ